MNNQLLLVILGMAVVTYIPRMLPLVVLNGKNIPSFLQRVLKNVPYAALGALIVPGVFLVEQNDIWFGIIGFLVAFLAAYLGANVIVVVLVSIIILSIYTYIL